MPRKIEFIIQHNYDGLKVKSFLKNEMQISTRLLNSLKQIENGMLLNGVHTRSIDILHEGDILELNLPDINSYIQPVKMPLDIIYEDDDIIAVNKSPFIAVHPTHNHQGDTLSNALTFYLKEHNKPTMIRFTGRLDKGTSGIVVCALNSHAAHLIPSDIKKEYTAVVCGELRGKGRIDSPIIRPDPMKTIRAVGENGEQAITNWECIKTNGLYSLIKIQLETGRTHQIRVHFASIGMPLLGDSLYGDDKLNIGHQLLHCGHVCFNNPITEKRIELFTDPPRDFLNISENI